jgi:hypothetical protein
MSLRQKDEEDAKDDDAQGKQQPENAWMPLQTYPQTWLSTCARWLMTR